MDSEVVIVSAVRTPIGRFGGTLSEVPAPELGAVVIKNAVERAKIPINLINEVYMGCVLQAGLGQNPSRQAAMKAGLKQEIPAFTLNVVCGSGLEAVNMAALSIRSGNAEVAVAGGMENMSAAPYILPKARFGFRMNDGLVKDTMIQDALWDAYFNYHMGMTAENIAARYKISRQEQDSFAVESQMKCETARNQGRFKDELIPIQVYQKKKEILFAEDEFPRNGVTVDSISHLQPSFKEGGTVTAGNASGINDGAAAVVLMRSDKAKELGIHPMARILAGSAVGVDPSVMGLGAGKAALTVMNKLNLTADDMTLIEANEAFASQSIACARMAGWDSGSNRRKVNVNGGSIALGHPVGASGCRILVTLLHELKKRGGGLGLASLCVGGGMGIATIVEGL